MPSQRLKAMKSIPGKLVARAGPYFYWRCLRRNRVRQRRVRAQIQRNQVFVYPVACACRIGQAATAQQALHSLIAGVNQDAQLVNLVRLGVALYPLPEATADPLPLESIFDQNAEFGGGGFCVRLAHIAGNTHDDFVLLLHRRHKTCPCCRIKAI